MVDVFSKDDLDEERKNAKAVLAAFHYYLRFSYARVQKTTTYLNTLNENHQEMLENYRNHLNKIRDCILTNNTVLKEMIRKVHEIFPDSNLMQESTCFKENGQVIKVRSQDFESPKVEPFKLLKVQTTLKQICRDWSKEGEEERAQCYQPIINEILEQFDPKEDRKWKILVPGSGLGRLIYELAVLGYYCEGNEVSLFMLIASNFVLNRCPCQNQYTIYPWVHQYCNTLNRRDQVAPVQFPDVIPSIDEIKGELKIIAGDFVQVYTETDDWDCVATCFFIDCANNIIEFIETIYRILTPGGIWINLGPLLYHYSEIDGENSIEPTFEDIIHIIKSVGFDLIKQKTGVRTKYAQNQRSILKTEYESLFWVCRKPIKEISH